MKLNLTSEEIIGNRYTANLWKFVMILSNSMLHCKKRMVVLTQFGYFSFLLSACIQWSPSGC